MRADAEEKSCGNLVAHTTYHIHFTAGLATRPLPTLRCQEGQYSEKRPSLTRRAGDDVLKVFDVVHLGKKGRAQEHGY